jgi:hypothetical protein
VWFTLREPDALLPTVSDRVPLRSADSETEPVGVIVRVRDCVGVRGDLEAVPGEFVPVPLCDTL